MLVLIVVPFGVMSVLWSRELGLSDQIQHFLVIPLYPSELYRSEPEAGKEGFAGISVNKVSGTSDDLVILCRSKMSLSPCLRGVDRSRG